jgi:hypothetical protein
MVPLLSVVNSVRTPDVVFETGTVVYFDGCNAIFFSLSAKKRRVQLLHTSYVFITHKIFQFLDLVLRIDVISHCVHFCVLFINSNCWHPMFEINYLPLVWLFKSLSHDMVWLLLSWIDLVLKRGRSWFSKFFQRLLLFCNKYSYNLCD